MKKLFYLMSMAAMVAVVASCNPNRGGEDKVEPTKLTLTEAFQDFFMAKGETIKLTYTVSPSNVDVDYTLVFASDDEEVATVDAEGNVTAENLGEVTITISIKEYPDVKPVKSNIKVLNTYKVGDFIYSDGSWGTSTIDKEINKDIIAMIYWIGDPTLFDPVLEAEYPNCTHGLAMSFKQGQPGKWQVGFQERFFGGGGLGGDDILNPDWKSAWCNEEASLVEWGVKYSPYSDIIEPYIYNDELKAGKSFVGISGYTLTSIMKQYMEEDPDAAQYPLEVLQNTMALVEGVEAPVTCSGWYVPSLFEAGLMVNTALTKPSDFDADDSVIKHNNTNVSRLNKELEKLSGVDKLPDSDADMASASDVYMPTQQIMTKGCRETLVLFAVMNVSIKTQEEIDKMTAEEKAEYESDLADANAFYKAALEAEGVEWNDDWANDNMYARAERYYVAKGWEYDADELSSEALGLVLALFTAQVATPCYANVDVETGKSHYVNPMYQGDDVLRGYKGEDNPKDYIRAVIAF